MLNSLRSFAGSPVGALIFAAIIAALLFFGLRGFGAPSMVGHVGSQTITPTEFQTAYDSELNAAQQQMGQYISPTRAASLQIPERALEGLTQRALLREVEKKLGMALSDDAVAAAVASETYFQQDGQFSQSILNAYLAQVGQTDGAVPRQLSGEHAEQSGPFRHTRRQSAPADGVSAHPVGVLWRAAGDRLHGADAGYADAGAGANRGRYPGLLRCQYGSLAGWRNPPGNGA